VTPFSGTRRKDALCIEWKQDGKVASTQRKFKRQAGERTKTCSNIGALTRELKLQRKLLYTWKCQLEGRPEPRHANLGTTAEERKDKQLKQDRGLQRAFASTATLGGSWAVKLVVTACRRAESRPT
jgi:hypothetical protein